MTEESKQQEKVAFSTAKAQNLKKMQEITQLIITTNKNEDIDEDQEYDDFENYMEQSLMAEAE